VSRFESPCICTRWQVSAEWSRCPDSMTRRARDSAAALQRISPGWMPARRGRLFTDVRRRHLVTVRKVLFMAGSMRQVRALWHQTGV